MLVLNKRYSTTRRIVKTVPFSLAELRSESSVGNGLKEQSIDFVDGGLRKQGYGKLQSEEKPVISVVTVVYNGADKIETAIKSVINQTYDNLEYIVVDGGSTDGTVEILQKYDDCLDYWLSESDENVYDAMNKATSLCSGQYVLFLGYDDYLFDVFHQVIPFLKNEYTSYYGNVLLSSKESLYGGRFHSFKLFLKNIPHQAIFYSNHVFEDIYFNCKYLAVADYALNLNIFANKKFGMKYIPITVAYYNDETGISSTLTDHAFSIDKVMLIKKYYPKIYYIIYRLVRFIYKVRQ